MIAYSVRYRNARGQFVAEPPAKGTAARRGIKSELFDRKTGILVARRTGVTTKKHADAWGKAFNRMVERAGKRRSLDVRQASRAYDPRFDFEDEDEDVDVVRYVDRPELDAIDDLDDLDLDDPEHYHD